jgi:hypothetical protein
MKASQPGRKSLASALVAPPSGNLLTHWGPLNSLDGGMKISTLHGNKI